MTGTTPARGGVSPSSSPRLPSPPPFTEVQIGPKSPSIGSSPNSLSLDDTTNLDEGASRRIRPGTKAADMAAGPPLVPLHQLDSPFQLQEHLKALYCSYTRDPVSPTVKPITKETAQKLAKPPIQSDTGEMVDKNLWLYELCRFLVMKCNDVVIAFFADKPPCSSITCPEMRASEWQYLCAVHEPPKSCCAIDYCTHTLDWACNILTNPKHFPSRLSLGGETGNVFQSMRQITNIFRRVYRIFAHAWFQHRDVFWAIESSDGLYVFFKMVCDVYQLIPEDNYTIPPEAEGDRDEQEETPINSQAPDMSNRIQIARKDYQSNGDEEQDPETTTTVSTGATTRRHKHTPSTGNPVSMIAEGQEEDDAPQTALEHGQFTQLPIRAASHSPPKAHAGEVDITQSLGRLDLNNRFPPDYEPRVPEDPTPTIDHHDDDPLAAAGARQSAFTPDAVARHPAGDKVEDQDEQAKEVSEDEHEEELEEEHTVLSASEDGVKPGSQAMLGTVLGHTDDLENTPADDSDVETTIGLHDEHDHEPVEKSTGHDLVDEKHDNDHEAVTQDTGKVDDEAEDEDGNETMERIEMPREHESEEEKAEGAIEAHKEVEHTHQTDATDAPAGVV